MLSRLLLIGKTLLVVEALLDLIVLVENVATKLMLDFKSLTGTAI